MSPEARARGEAPPQFLILLAMMTSIVALTIDAVLPALDTIAADLAFADPNGRQRIVFAVFLGLGISQLIFGPLSDMIGRKPAVMAGWAIYLCGSLLGAAAWDEGSMLAGRALQGLGAGAPRIVSAAIVRDLYAGRPMARILSLIMTVFMLVPMLAPLIGQGIEALGGWRAIFGVYLAMAGAAAFWYWRALPETLAVEARRPLSLGPLLAAFREVLGSRAPMLYTLSAVCVFAPFVTYLGTAQQILEERYALGDLFPLAFGALALVFAVASFANARMVLRIGMRRACLLGLALMVGASTLAAGLIAGLGEPGLALFLGLMALVFMAVAVLFANFTALALQELGHVAGTASAVVMSLGTLGAAPIGLAIAQRYDGSVAPLFHGFLVLGALGLLFLWLAERGR